MLFSQFITTTVSIFITPFTMIAAVFLVEWIQEWYHGAAVTKKALASKETQHD